MRQTSKSLSTDSLQSASTSRPFGGGPRERRLVDVERELVEERLAAGDHGVARLQTAAAALHAAPGLDLPEAVEDQLRRADVQLDRLARRPARLQLVAAAAPLEREQRDVAGLLDDALHERLRFEDALLDQHRSQALAGPDRAPGVFELPQREETASQQPRPEAVVGVRGGGEDELAALGR